MASTLNLAALAESEEVSKDEFTLETKPVADEIKAFVDAGYKHWQAEPKVWRKVPLGSEDAVKEVTRDARRYAKATGRTFRRKSVKNTGLLVYKVTDQSTSAEDGETAETSGDE